MKTWWYSRAWTEIPWQMSILSGRMLLLSADQWNGNMTRAPQQIRKFEATTNLRWLTGWKSLWQQHYPCLRPASKYISVPGAMLASVFPPPPRPGWYVLPVVQRCQVALPVLPCGRPLSSPINSKKKSGTIALQQDMGSSTYVLKKRRGSRGKKN